MEPRDIFLTITAINPDITEADAAQIALALAFSGHCASPSVVDLAELADEIKYASDKYNANAAQIVADAWRREQIRRYSPSVPSADDITRALYTDHAILTRDEKGDWYAYDTDGERLDFAMCGSIGGSAEHALKELKKLYPRALAEIEKPRPEMFSSDDE